MSRKSHRPGKARSNRKVTSSPVKSAGAQASASALQQKAIIAQKAMSSHGNDASVIKPSKIANKAMPTDEIVRTGSIRSSDIVKSPRFGEDFSVAILSPLGRVARRFIPPPWILRGVLSQLAPTMAGGAVIFAMLATVARVFPSSEELQNSLVGFRDSALMVDQFLLLLTLLLFFVGILLSGFKATRALNKFAVQPALKFCRDFCATAVGAMLMFWLVTVWPLVGRATLALLGALVVATSASLTFAYASFLTEDEGEMQLSLKQVIIRAVAGCLGVGVIALIIWLYYS